MIINPRLIQIVWEETPTNKKPPESQIKKKTELLRRSRPIPGCTVMD